MFLPYLLTLQLALKSIELLVVFSPGSSCALWVAVMDSGMPRREPAGVPYGGMGAKHLLMALEGSVLLPFTG